MANEDVLEIVRKLQSKTLPMLKELQNFFDQEGLQYFLIGGGLIGAKRHKGFIPWDDDIDICLPRPDYEKLIRLEKKFAFPYEIRHWGNDPEHIYPYAKLYDTSTTIVEDLKKPFKRGVWIDIFPIDGTFNSNLLRRIHFHLTRRVRYLINISAGIADPSSKNPKTIIKNKITNELIQIIPLPVLKTALQILISAKRFETSNYVANLFGRWGEKESCLKSIFKKEAYLDFENIKIRTMAGHEMWLDKVYGDYMDPPPHEFRIPDHKYSFIDLDNSFK